MTQLDMTTQALRDHCLGLCFSCYPLAASLVLLNWVGAGAHSEYQDHLWNLNLSCGIQHVQFLQTQTLTAHHLDRLRQNQVNFEPL